MEGLDEHIPISPGFARRPPAPGVTVGVRSVAQIDRRRIVLRTPGRDNRGTTRWKSASLFLGTVLAVTLGAAVVGIGLWLPIQF